MFGKTLDVGSGNGRVARAVHDDIVGIDVYVPPATEIEVQKYDGVHIPFADKSFDTVMCCTAFHHAEEPDALIEEMKRVGKRLVLLEDCVDTRLNRWSVLSLHWRNLKLYNLTYRPENFRTREGWAQFFERHGMRLSTSTLYPGIQPDWLFLRHYLFVLEAP